MSDRTSMTLESARSSGSSGKSKPTGFIDAHVHVWTDDVNRYPVSPPFAPGDMNPSIASPDLFLDEARRSAVDRAVLIQMSYYGCDNSYMLDMIRRFTGVFSGVAVVDWKGIHPDKDMRELAKHGVRGFRIDAEGDPAAASSGAQGLEKMFLCGAEYRLAICYLMLPDGLPAIARLCERFPETPVVLDHLAQVGVRGTFPAEQVEALCALSRYYEVIIKISGFYALGLKRPPHQELVPLIRRVYEAFGPQRIMWGSDYPFQLFHGTYEDSISLVRDRLDFVSREDKEWLFRRTAESLFFP